MAKIYEYNRELSIGKQKILKDGEIVNCKDEKSITKKSYEVEGEHFDCNNRSLVGMSFCVGLLVFLGLISGNIIKLNSRVASIFIPIAAFYLYIAVGMFIIRSLLLSKSLLFYYRLLDKNILLAKESSINQCKVEELKEDLNSSYQSSVKFFRATLCVSAISLGLLAFTGLIMGNVVDLNKEIASYFVPVIAALFVLAAVLSLRNYVFLRNIRAGLDYVFKDTNVEITTDKSTVDNKVLHNYGQCKDKIDVQSSANVADQSKVLNMRKGVDGKSDSSKTEYEGIKNIRKRKNKLNFKFPGYFGFFKVVLFFSAIFLGLLVFTGLIMGNVIESLNRKVALYFTPIIGVLFVLTTAIASWLCGTMYKNRKELYGMLLIEEDMNLKGERTAMITHTEVYRGFINSDGPKSEVNVQKSEDSSISNEISSSENSNNEVSSNIEPGDVSFQMSDTSKLYLVYGGIV